MKRLALVATLAAALLIPAAAAVSGSECPDPAEFTARYGFTPQEYVNRVATAELKLTAEQESIKAVAAGNQTVDRWSPVYGMQMGMPVLKYGDLYFQARMVEFRDGEIDFGAALSYLGGESHTLYACGFVDGETVRASLQGIEAVVIVEPSVQPAPRPKSPALLRAIERLQRYIANLSKPGARDPDGHLAIYRARLAEYQAR